jgi:protein phosphatase
MSAQKPSLFPGLSANDFGSCTSVGRVREHNEDALIVQPPLYAVADGMGGHAAGEVASEIAITTLAQHAPLVCDTPVLIDTVAKINRAIITAADDGRGRKGMGTTLTAAILDGNCLLIAQVGDSRAYLLRAGKLRQLTRDHSFVGELLAGGHISAQEAAIHPKRSMITRALGSEPKTEADIYEVELVVGDRLLLCTDGLSGMVADSAIKQLLTANPDAQVATDALVEAALAAGGMDNISVIVVNVNDTSSGFLGNDKGRPNKGRGRQPRSSGDRSALAALPKTEKQDELPPDDSPATAASGNKRGLRVHLGVLTFLLLVVLLIGGAIGGTWLYASNSTFLRTLDGKVAVYRGLPGEILPGIRLEWLEYSTDVSASDLLTSTAERLDDGIQVESLNAAAKLVASYEQQADVPSKVAGP